MERLGRVCLNRERLAGGRYEGVQPQRDPLDATEPGSLPSELRAVPAALASSRRFCLPWPNPRQWPIRSRTLPLPRTSHGPSSSPVSRSSPRARTPRSRSRRARPGAPRSTPRWPSSTPASTQPSVEWRRRFSLLLGLERLLGEEEPRLVDGTVLSAHQVDALSGTLTALLAEAAAATATGTPTAPSPADDVAALAPVGIPGEEDDEEEEDGGAAGLAPRGRGGRGRPARGAARGPQRRQALLVRARHGRRQDGRRARLRRGLAHRRRPDPHPPPQPRGPVPRRAARPRLLEAHLPGAARRQGPGQRPRHRRDLPVVRPQRGQDLRRLHDRHLRRGAHRAGREDLRVDPPVERPDLHRHDRDGRADRPPRHRPLPDADLALRPRAGRAPRRHRAAALHADPARPRRAHDRQGAAAPRRGGHGVRPGDAGRAAGPAAVQPGRRRPLQDPLQRRARRRLRRRRAPRLQRRRGVPRRRA